ncbi:MAG: hypothetical protein ACJAR2_003238 [Ilumatobacter sp.]|jgi:hypothetical protein
MIQLQSVGNLSRRPELFQPSIDHRSELVVAFKSMPIGPSHHTVGSTGRLPLDLLMIRLTVGLDLPTALPIASQITPFSYIDQIVS